MSSAAVLGQKWAYDPDLDNISVAIKGLEKHSKPNHLRSTLLLDNGPPGLQVSKISVIFIFV